MPTKESTVKSFQKTALTGLALAAVIGGGVLTAAALPDGKRRRGSNICGPHSYLDGLAATVKLDASVKVTATETGGPGGGHQGAPGSNG